jgi:sulfite reductase (NADPH) hemoprotein beta-component
MSPAIITANRLLDGDVVFWAGGGWVEALSDAERFEDGDGLQRVLAQAKGQTTTVIDPYAIDIVIEGGQPVPASYRERIRALGPTTHPDHGKQARGGADIEAIAAHAGAGVRSTGRLGLIRRK